MTRLFLMVEHSGASRPPVAPLARSPVPPARRGGGDGTAEQPSSRRRGWDIPWLGGRSTAPWVVLATVLILLVATVGALYAKSRPDRLGWSPKTMVVRDDATVFTFSVYKAPAAVAACDIVAADRDGGVGTLRDIPIPARPDGAENTEITVTVPTTRRAATAVLEGCRIVRSR